MAQSRLPTSDEVSAGYLPPFGAMVVDDTEHLGVPAPVVSGADLFDPDAHTVADVVAHLNASDHAEVDRVLAAERAGQARKGVTEYHTAAHDRS